MELTVPAHGKVNWILEASGEYPSGHPNHGYCAIRSVMFKIELHDLITVEVHDSKGQNIYIECDKKEVPQSCTGSAEQNICFKAVKALKRILPAFPGNDLSIYIKKNLPFSGGLGGSATDGAAVLRALNILYELDLSDSTLIKAAALIGSDTPFFTLDCKAALAEGRGERISPLPSPEDRIWLAVAESGLKLDSGQVYRSLKECGFAGCGKSSEKIPALMEVLISRKGGIEKMCSLLHNDLTNAPAVMEGFSDRTRIEEALLEAGCAGVLMSGSGSAVFGVLKNKEEFACSIADSASLKPLADCYLTYI